MVAFICSNKELSEREVKKTIHLKLYQKEKKYLGINLTKEVKDLYTENLHCWKELKKRQRNGEIFCAHGLEELILLKYSYHLKQSADSV